MWNFRSLRTTRVLLVAFATVTEAVVVKKLVHTSWWPPANDKFEEAVGVISRDVLSMTGMMEPQTPLPTFNITRDIRLELEDIRDIVAAGNTSLESIVDCIINVPPGSASTAHTALVTALGGTKNAPGVTVIETQGEDPTFNSSTTCYASVTDAVHTESTLGVHTTTSGELVWLTTTIIDDPARCAIDLNSAIRHATDGAGSATDLVDCLAFVPHGAAESAEKVRNAIATVSSSRTGVPSAALTVVETGLGEEATVKLRCTAIVGAAKNKVAKTAANVRTVVAGGFAFVDGVAARSPNGTDAFEAMSESLRAAGSRMDLVLNCLFFVVNEAGIDPIFSGFDVAFNVDAPPPPSRTEFVGTSPAFQCRSNTDPCPVLAKCIAAMPA